MRFAIQCATSRKVTPIWDRLLGQLGPLWTIAHLLHNRAERNFVIETR